MPAYYKHDSNGKSQWGCTSNPSRVPTDCTAIESDRIPDEESQKSYDTQKYKNGLVIKDQEKNCQKLLDDSDKKMVSDTPYPDDIQKWIDYRTTLRRIIKSNIIEEIPEKPF